MYQLISICLDSKYCSKNSVHSPSTSKQDWSVNRTCIEENTEGKKIIKILKKKYSFENLNNY